MRDLHRAMFPYIGLLRIAEAFGARSNLSVLATAHVAMEPPTPGSPSLSALRRRDESATARLKAPLSRSPQGETALRARRPGPTFPYDANRTLPVWTGELHSSRPDGTLSHGWVNLDLRRFCGAGTTGHRSG